MSEPKITAETFQFCYGWAYEPCGVPAMWVGVEWYENGSWSAEPLCGRHAAEFLGDSTSWTQRPKGRQLIQVEMARAMWRD